jgi:hypothetical protein
MLIIRIILFFNLLTVTGFCLGQNRAAQRREDHEELVLDSNLPSQLREFYGDSSISSGYLINKDLNPFYLRGDFDGDRKMDYALSIVDRKTKKKGIVIYHTGTKKYFLLGAGVKIQDGYDRDDLDWMDAWTVYDKENVEQGVTSAKPPKLKGEAIYAEKLESSSGIICWDGKGYRWYQQGD